jgi:hypothetical protein
MEIQLFWYVTPCRLVLITDLSKECRAFIFRVKQSIELHEMFEPLGILVLLN